MISELFTQYRNKPNTIKVKALEIGIKSNWGRNINCKKNSDQSHRSAPVAWIKGTRIARFQTVWWKMSSVKNSSTNVHMAKRRWIRSEKMKEISLTSYPLQGQKAQLRETRATLFLWYCADCELEKGVLKDKNTCPDMSSVLRSIMTNIDEKWYNSPRSASFLASRHV